MRFLVLTALIVAASATEIDVKSCYGVDSSVCTIHQITIDPCNLQNNQVCKLTKGQDARIVFDFTPNFSTDKLGTGVMYGATSWPNLDPDGCKATTCPTVAGTRQTYDVNLYIGKKLPKGTYQVEWSVWDINNNSTNKCCFKTTLKLNKT